MILLSLDSTEITASAAVTDGRRLVAQTVVRSGHTHSETLLPAISFIMKSAALSFEELNGFACSVGPGSFTGVRIGVATIKGLAFGRGKPCIGVSALEAMAYALGDCGGVICPVMDARRNQLYNAVFRACGGTVARLTPDRVIAAGDLAGELRIKYRNEPIFLCGEGSDILRAAGPDLPFGETPALLRYETAYGVALAAEAKIAAGAPLAELTDAALAPLYLRPSQAERMKSEAARAEM